MITVGAFEAKTHLSQLLERVERGEEITITRRGRAVARLVPVTVGHDREAALAAFRRLRERAARLRLGKFDWTEWKAYVDEGRP
ncbi:MAG TPA: type II toxin-antitoxin system prevent-host-death family antitoxin [Geminicoccaceae bacterium]|nr:type II toxin-antitoxin system prevent-host-death family antitoxin [Geminicoccaceae bacterium]